MRHPPHNGPSPARFLAPLVAFTALPFCAGAATPTDPTYESLVSQHKFCSATARVQRRACANDVLNDYWTSLGICTNEPEAADRQSCLQDVEDTRVEGNQECAEQNEAREELCAKVGQHRYDVEFEPRFFDNDFTHLTKPNPYFPLKVGSQWEYRSADEVDKVRVTSATKLIDDVRCIVVRDEVSEDGVVTEGTNDWFAQAKDGAVWYCGEESASFETFRGDRPQKPELVSIEGSFKADRDGAEPGVIFLATPVKGKVYIEEKSLGTAEDASEVLAVDYAYGKYPQLDALVPPALAKLLCKAGDCVVARDFSPLEPDANERKYYAKGIGLFLETEPDTGEVNRLVNCNVDPRCAQLPP